MAVMKEDLKLLLRRNGVHDDVCNWLAASPQDCHDIKVFANIVDEANQLKSTVLSHTSQKDNIGQLARLKQAWKEADGINQTRLKRLGQGIAEDALDEPLDAETRRSKYTVFQNFYQWTLKAREMVCDSLLGRLVREFEAGQPSMFAVLRARSVANAQRSQPTKKHRISDTVQINVAHAEDDVSVLEDTSRLRTYFACFRTLGTGWAVAGCYDVSYEGKQMKFCRWQDVCTYIGHLEGKAWSAVESFPEDLVLAYILQTEEKIRATAIERCRNEGMPWGRALLHAWKDEAELWPDAKDEWLMRRFSVRRTGAKDEPLKPSQPVTSAASKIKPATATMLPNGAEICKRRNDARGCPGAKCPQGKAHCCDVLLATGAVCASTTHTRAEHDPTKHGQVTPFTKA